MARILIIDDEELSRFTMRAILEEAIHEVCEAEDGEAGVALHKAQPFDLVITDTIMSKKSGVQTIIELKRDYPSLQIIAVSGSGITSPESFLAQATRYGADRVLAKPFTEDEILECVNACLSAPQSIRVAEG